MASKKATRITGPTTSDPVTNHSIEDRRALTSDALKLSKHELQKEFKRRIEALKEDGRKLWESTEPLRDAYNTAVANLIGSVGRSVVDDLEHSFRCINRLSASKCARAEDDDDEYRLAVTVTLGEDYTFFEGSASNETRLNEKMRPFLSGNKLSARHYRLRQQSMHSIVEEAHDSGDGDPCYANDLTIPVAICIGSNEDLSITRYMDITCSFDLEQARRAFEEPAAQMKHIAEQLEKAEEDLERLPEMIKELDMHATALRISEAGGARFLESIMTGVQRIMSGDTHLSGLALAMEEEPEAGETSEQ